MRYTFGCRRPGKDGKVSDGLYLFNGYGLPYIINMNALNNLKNTDRILVAETAEDAKKYVRHLSNCYRKEFLNIAKKENLNLSDFRFYVMKLDSSNFTGAKFTDNNKRLEKEHSYIKIFNVIQQNKDE